MPEQTGAHVHKYEPTGVVSLDGCGVEYRCACGKYTTAYEPERMIR